MSKSTWPTSSCGFSMMNSRIPSVTKIAGYLSMRGNHTQTPNKCWKDKTKSWPVSFLAKILTCAFPKLKTSHHDLHLVFNMALFAPGVGGIVFGVCCKFAGLAIGQAYKQQSTSIRWQHQMLHLLLLYPHLGCRIGPQRPQVTQIGHWRFTPFLVIPIPSMGLVHLPTWMVAFCGKCREIYQPHGSYGWCRFTALLSSMYIGPSLLVLLVFLVLLSRPQPSGWGIKSGTGYKKIRNASMWCCAINPDWEVDGAFLQCVQSIVAPYLHFQGSCVSSLSRQYISQIKAWCRNDCWTNMKFAESSHAGCWKGDQHVTSLLGRDVGSVRYLWHIIAHPSKPQLHTFSWMK